MRVVKGKNLCSVLISVLVLVVFALSARASTFDIVLNFVDSLTPSQQTVFEQAESYWEGIIAGYQTGISIASLKIGVRNEENDGVGGTLASAGIIHTVLQSEFTLPTRGFISFDSADLSNLESNGTLNDVILHEMAHVIGFGTLWIWNNVYVDGTGRYFGASALAAYRNEFNSEADFVPVELGGGVGTANGHWNEVEGGSGLTGIVDSHGNDMRYELMTGWLNSPVFISNTTLMSFEDIGYEVSIVPIPGTLFLLGSGMLGLFGIRRRKRRWQEDDFTFCRPTPFSPVDRPGW